MMRYGVMILAVFALSCTRRHDPDGATSSSIRSGNPAPSTRVVASAPPSASVAAPKPPDPEGKEVILEGGDKGVGFDDLALAPQLGRLLVPGGGTGKLILLDPKTLEQRAIDGFSKAAFSGNLEGATSATEGPGVVLALDRTAKELRVVDPHTGTIVGSTALAGAPARVGWMENTAEIWVSEPDASQLEVFTLVGSPSRPRLIASVPVKDGLTGMLVDRTRGRVYVNTTTGRTVAIEVGHHQPAGTWKNGCEDARGLALDPPRGLLFVACHEGKVIALDIDRNGKKVGELVTGAGIDSIAYDVKLAHLAVPSPETGLVTLASAGGGGVLQKLGDLEATKGAHCATYDGDGRVFVCDPARGRLVIVTDTYPPVVPSAPVP